MSAPVRRERRLLKRHLECLPAHFESEGRKGQGHIKNISKEGLFLRTDDLPTAGAQVRVIIEPESADKVEIEGIVRWTTAQLPESIPAPSGFGLHIQGDLKKFQALFERTLLN